MAIADRRGLLLALWVSTASPHEGRLVEQTLRARFCQATRPRLIGDKAYPSEPLDQHLRRQCVVEFIAPHMLHRSRPVSEDGRPLRRHRPRWNIERLFAWLHNYPRVVNRCPANFAGILQLVRVFSLAEPFMGWRLFVNGRNPVTTVRLSKGSPPPSSTTSDLQKQENRFQECTSPI